MTNESRPDNDGNMTLEVQAMLRDSTAVLLLAGAGRYIDEFVEAARQHNDEMIEDLNDDMADPAQASINEQIIKDITNDQRDLEAVRVAELPVAVRYYQYTEHYDKKGNVIFYPEEWGRQRRLLKALGLIEEVESIHQREEVHLSICKVDTNGKVYRNVFMDVAMHVPETGEITKSEEVEIENYSTVTPELLGAVLAVYKAEVEQGWQPEFAK